MFHELAPAARLRGTAVAYHELEAYGGEGEKDAAAAWAAGVLDVGERPAAATTFPLEPAADDPWADDEPRPGDTIATPLSTRPLTCPEALALELTPAQAAYAVDWADELAALTPDELEAYAGRFAGGGSMGQAAILEATYRAVKASR